MNPVFASRIGAGVGSDNDGRIFQLAGNSVAPGSTVPGALPRTPAPRVTLASAPQPQQSRTANAPATMASVPMPQPAPQPKEGAAPPEQQKTIGGLIGKLFGEPKAEPRPAPPAPESTQVALRGSNPEPAAKPRFNVVRSAAAATVNTPKPQAAAAPKPQALAANPPEPAVKKSEPPGVMQQSAKTAAPRAPEHELRTAFSAPPASGGGLLTGAQPVIPAGSFDSRSSGFR
ncbi:MAG: hypothetical protein HY244_15370 [Rhizobiales bacterium]|nr:hypothetical protein [Hyphomicrobiales bacterium]